MTRADPGPGCLDFSFARSYAMSEAAEVALEDYARALAGSLSAETVLEAAGGVSGVHLCGAAPASAAPLRGELEDFARGLAERAQGAGLGWE